MSKSQMLIFAGVLLLLVGSLPACSALATPRQIATYPLSTSNPEPLSALEYDTYLQLEVSDVDVAVEAAIDLTYRVGGLSLDSRSWEQQGTKRATLVLAAPAAHSDALRSDLLELGTPVQEQLSSRRISRADEGPYDWTYFTVHFQASPRELPVFSSTGWRPMRTLARAWSVFISIFGFLTDILIWVAVVIGPFILAGLIVWMIIRRYRSRHVNRM